MFYGIKRMRDFGLCYGCQYRPLPAHQNSAKVSLYIAPLGQGHGLGQALHKALIEHLPGLGFHTLVGIVTTPNPASALLHKTYDFELIGTF